MYTDAEGSQDTTFSRRTGTDQKCTATVFNIFLRMNKQVELAIGILDDINVISPQFTFIRR